MGLGASLAALLLRLAEFVLAGAARLRVGAFGSVTGSGSAAGSCRQAGRLSDCAQTQSYGHKRAIPLLGQPWWSSCASWRALLQPWAQASCEVPYWQLWPLLLRSCVLLELQVRSVLLAA